MRRELSGFDPWRTRSELPKIPVGLHTMLQLPPFGKARIHHYKYIVDLFMSFGKTAAVIYLNGFDVWPRPDRNIIRTNDKGIVKARHEQIIIRLS
jgi:hypothetical protein